MFNDPKKDRFNDELNLGPKNGIFASTDDEDNDGFFDDKKEEKKEENNNDSDQNKDTDKKTESDKKPEDKKQEEPKEKKSTIEDDLAEFEKWISKQNKKRRKRNLFPNFIPLIILILIILYFIFGRGSNKDYDLVSYTDFVQKVEAGQITKVSERGDYLYGEATFKGNTLQYRTREITDRLGEDENLMNSLKEKNVEIESLDNTNRTSIILQFILSLSPIIIIIIFFIYLRSAMNKGEGSGGGILGIGMNSGINKVSEVPAVRFKDVAGVDGAKEELKEVVDFLKTPEKFIAAGAKIPKGILLEGDPGTGKTLLAKAVAGESGSAFFTMSGSEFVEMYVGVGASRVRKLFKEAKASKPAIIFIDEIDAVGRARGNNRSGGNDEREQTLNQLLVEMDGFADNENVIVMAATNRADILDSALTRSGRFDRKVRVELPDMQGRIDILKVHSRNKHFNSDVRLEDIARITPGFSGADLANLLNEAAILAARESRTVIRMADLDEAVDKLGMGLSKKNKKLSEKTKKTLAYHEGGHALIASLLPDANKVHKVTIIGRGGAGGYMMPLPEEKVVITKEQILAQIMVSLAGRGGEKVMLNQISSGASSDIEGATNWAMRMVRIYGMDDEFGMVDLYESSESFKNTLSDETNREIELRIRQIIKDQYNKTIELLEENKEKLEGIAQLLIAKETITGSEVRAIVAGKTVEEVMNMSETELEQYY